MLVLGSMGVPCHAQPSVPDAGGVGLIEVVERLLALDPNIALEATQVDLARGALLGQAARFDLGLTSGLDRSDLDTPSSERESSDSESLEATFGATRELRSGLSLEPSLSLSQTDEDGPFEAVNLGTVSFTLRQPLLRDRGRAVVTAGERAAGSRLRAADLNLGHRVAERVRAVAAQYWAVVAAWQNLEILRTTEASARTFLDTNRRLVAADARPEAELVLLEADLADKESATLAGEQLLFQTQRTLALEIGLPVDEMHTLPLPSDPLPEELADPRLSRRDMPALIALALARRADLRAARRQQESDEILLVAADDALKPTLDLVVTPSWTGLVDGDDLGALLSSSFRNVPGLSSSLGLAFSFPVGNRLARGNRIQAEASRRASELTVALFERQIGASVPITFDAVLQSRLQLERAAQAVELFERAVTNEETKLRAGRSTLIDVITQRDRLTASRQTLVSARLALALALLDLRFETGTLLTEAPGAETSQVSGTEPYDTETDDTETHDTGLPGHFRVRREDLVTLPPLEP